MSHCYISNAMALLQNMLFQDSNEDNLNAACTFLCWLITPDNFPVTLFTGPKLVFKITLLFVAFSCKCMQQVFFSAFLCIVDDWLY